MNMLLWQARIKQKITLQELSKMTGISKTMLNYYENNVYSPTMVNMEKIAKALNTNITELFESDYK